MSRHYSSHSSMSCSTCANFFAGPCKASVVFEDIPFCIAQNALTSHFFYGKVENNAQCQAASSMAMDGRAIFANSSYPCAFSGYSPTSFGSTENQR